MWKDSILFKSYFRSIGLMRQSLLFLIIRKDDVIGSRFVEKKQIAWYMIGLKFGCLPLRVFGIECNEFRLSTLNNWREEQKLCYLWWFFYSLTCLLEIFICKQVNKVVFWSWCGRTGWVSLVQGYWWMLLGPKIYWWGRFFYSFNSWSVRSILIW